MVCSDCFKNEGLRLEALKLGHTRSEKCPRCGSEKGAFLNENQCGELLEKFFIDGTMSIGTFGISPYKLGAGNPHDIKFDLTLHDDFEILIAVDALGLRRRSPKTWHVGDTKHWGAFEEMIQYRRTTGKLPENADETVDEILERCRKFTLRKGIRFYRIRKNLEASILAESYDSPSAQDRPSRLSRDGISVLYGAFDAETCIHESRCRIDDEICVATMETLVDLNTVNLGDAPYHPEKDDPWTSPSIFLSQVMRSPQHDECQIIGERAFEHGISAVQFPSFFSQVLDNQHANIAIFGRPIREKKARIHSLNRIKLERVRYEYVFGPIYDNSLH